jgi:clan AA aspartic protease (TIGR02281 family)
MGPSLRAGTGGGVWLRIVAALGALALLAACAETPSSVPRAAAGQTTIRYSDGGVYVGQVRNGLRDGQGTYVWADGRRYTGSFKDGFSDGRGIYTLPNGEKYEGDYAANRRTGQGTYTWADGRRYVGAFRDDLPNGQGVYTWPDGRRKAGEFHDGEFVGDANVTLAAAQAVDRVRVAGAGEVPMRWRNGAYVVSGLINDSEEVEFFLDSGAADVSIPSHTFERLRQSGGIRDTDLTGRETYTMANGQARTALTFRIRALRIGPVLVENVRGSVLDYAGPPLLGMSFLGRFAQWSVDNSRHVLILH